MGTEELLDHLSPRDKRKPAPECQGSASSLGGIGIEEVIQDFLLPIHNITVKVSSTASPLYSVDSAPLPPPKMPDGRQKPFGSHLEVLLHGLTELLGEEYFYSIISNRAMTAGFRCEELVKHWT